MKIYFDQNILEKSLEANCGRNYQQCSLSVMDTIADPDIIFDSKGISNYYYEYLNAEKNQVLKGKLAENEVNNWVTRIKKEGKGKKYDCMIGVSGGVDSTYLAFLAKKYNLRVLCVHFDNGWNSELAVSNINNIVEKCGFDLFTYVIDWNEFRDIQRSYFKANVIDIEAVTDIAIFSMLDKISNEHKIKYILDGRNIVTEQVLPKSWIFKDITNLKNIQKQFGTVNLKSYPIMSFRQELYGRIFKKFISIPLLNYHNYNKQEVKKTIIDKLDWVDYGGKHYESIFTRFYQGYILPNKFYVDKRKAHLSNLIFSKQLTKNEALVELKKPLYEKNLLIQDKKFVIKKLGFTDNEFNEYIKSEAINHKIYGHGNTIYDRFPLLKIIKPLYQKIKN